MRGLLVVLDNALSEFDLLVINEPILSRAGLLLEYRVRSSPNIQHLLVYQDGDLQLSAVHDSPFTPMRFSLSCPPDQESIRHVISVVDEGDGWSMPEKS